MIDSRDCRGATARRLRRTIVTAPSCPDNLVRGIRGLRGDGAGLVPFGVRDSACGDAAPAPGEPLSTVVGCPQGSGRVFGMWARRAVGRFGDTPKLGHGRHTGAPRHDIYG